MSVEPKILTWQFSELEMKQTSLDLARIFISLGILDLFQLLLLAFLI